MNSTQDALVDGHVVLGAEGGPLGEQLENEDAKGPVVGRDVVARVGDDLRRDVLRGTAERPRLVTGRDQLVSGLIIHLQ